MRRAIDSRALGENELRLNHNQRAYWIVQVTQRWYVHAHRLAHRCRLTKAALRRGGATGRRLSLRLEILGALITFGSALFAVLGKSSGIDPCTCAWTRSSLGVACALTASGTDAPRGIPPSCSAGGPVHHVRAPGDRVHELGRAHGHAGGGPNELGYAGGARPHGR